MSIFQTQGIVMQVIKLSERELMYKILFREYGVLTVKKKKKIREKPIDIGYLVQSEIITHSGRDIHTIGNIKILSFFDTKERLYLDIEQFLKIVSLVKKELPNGLPHGEIYDILFFLIENSKDISGYKFLLTRLKIVQSLGNLPENNNDQTVQKILKFIHSHKYTNIMRLGKIPDDIVGKLESVI